MTCHCVLQMWCWSRMIYLLVFRRYYCCSHECESQRLLHKNIRTVPFMTYTGMRYYGCVYHRHIRDFVYINCCVIRSVATNITTLKAKNKLSYVFDDFWMTLSLIRFQHCKVCNAHCSSCHFCSHQVEPKKNLRACLSLSRYHVSCQV